MAEQDKYLKTIKSSKEDKSSIRKRLSKLFTSSIIYRQKGKNSKIVIDPSMFQSAGSLSNTRASDKYARIYRTSTAADAFGYSSTTNQGDYSALIQQRIVLYSDYESMDTNSIISSALDIYSDECCTKNENGEILSINCADNEIKEILYNLFYDILNIETNLWSWVRNTCKYGDMYLGLHVQEKFGIVGVVPLSSYFMVRQDGSETDPFDVKYKLINPEVSSGYTNKSYYSQLKEEDKDEFENYEIAHFRLLGDLNFLPYGRSTLEGVRKDFKILMMLEDAMLLHRIMRAPERRIFRIDIGNIAPEEVDAYMQSIMDKMKKVPHINEETGEYNLRFNIQNMLEDFYIPTRGDSSALSIDSLPGLDYTPVEDLDYVKSKIFAGLKIPKAFLGYDENVAGKSTLAQEDLRFARTIDRIQKMMLSELNKLALIHLYAMGYGGSKITDFKISLTNPSLIYEQERIEILNQKVSLAAAMKDLKMLSREYIYRNIFNFSEDMIYTEAEKALNDLVTVFNEGKMESDGKLPEEEPEETTEESYDYERDNKKNNSTKKIQKFKLGPKGGSPPGGWPNAGRPKENKRRGTDKSTFGRDPLGNKETKNAVNNIDKKLKHNFKGNSPLSLD
jgi:hypothetical protein